MVYEFIFFEEQFHSVVTKTTFPKNFFAESAKNLDKEYFRLIRVFRDIAVRGKKRKKIKTYFNFHQKNLIILMDKVFSKLEENRIQSANCSHTQDSLELLLAKMYSFLEWLEKMFPRYFNIDEKVPRCTLMSEIEKINLKVKMLIKLLEDRMFRSDFTEMVRLVSDQKLILNYRDVAYWNTTWNITYQKLFEYNIADEFEALKLLIENGINHCEFYRYMKNFIIEEIERKPTLDEQISTICLYRKDIRLLFSGKRNRQFLEYPSIKRVLKKFIREELLLLRAMEFVNHGLAEAGIMNASYKVSFSVKQLAFFVHLQMETGIIIWQRAKFAHQYIARHFSTVERESISEKSVRNAHYSHAGEDIKKVIAKLSEMLALAQERY